MAVLVPRDPRERRSDRRSRRGAGTGARGRLKQSSAVLAAAALVGQQVAARATRDALFLSHHDVSRLPPSSPNGCWRWCPLPRRRVLAAITAVCWIAIRRVAATPALSVTDSGEPAPSGSRVLRDVPYLQGVAALVALGAFAEALLDYLLSARAVERFGPGAPLMGFFAAFHTGVSVAAAAVLAVGAAPALRHLGIAGVVALRPAAAGIGALTAWLAPGLLTAVLARGRGGRPAQLSLSHRLRAPLHPAAVRAQAPGQGDPGRRLRSRRHGGRQRRRDGGARHERRAPYGPACSHGRGRDPDRGDCGEAAPRLLRTAAVLAITEDKPEDL